VACFHASGAATAEPFDVLGTKPKMAPSGVLDYDFVEPLAHGHLTGVEQYNSSRKVNSVRRPRTGEYVVTMPGPPVGGPKTGTVKVTPFGNASGTCQVARWIGQRTGQQITVECFALGGAPQNRDFAMVYARSNNLMGQNGKIDANALVVAGGTVYQPTVQYDSRPHARVTIAHLGTGVYQFIPAGSGPTGHFSGGDGDLQVTPLGSSYRTCGFTIEPTHTPFVLIGCDNALGHAVNAAFIVQWVVN